MKKYRLSSYAISIKLESEPNDCLLIHGYTGAIDLIDKSIVKFLIENSLFDKAVLPCEESTKDALEKRGYITIRTEDEEKELRSLNVELPTLYVEELEQRLETDPLAIGGFLSGNIDAYADSCKVACGIDCDEYRCEDCGVYCDVKCGRYS